MLRIRECEDALLAEICHLFFACERSPQQISEELNKRWELEEPLTREQIYPLLREARRRSHFSLLPPLDRALAEAVASEFDLHADRLHIVPVRGRGALEMVAERAAALITDRIRDVGREKSRVHIGLGAGGTLTLVAQRLATRLRSEARLPPLALHALSSGFSVERPQTAPVSFFSSFHDVAPDIEYIGLFASAVVARSDYKREIQRRGVSESFEQAHEIDIVVTALARARDPHGELTHYIVNKSELERMREAGWVGDVLYRPYTESGPLRRGASVRAVSLFELEELVQLAQAPGKHVVLVAAPCAQCGKRKGPALRPLLASPALRIWSELVMDIPTAEELLTDPLLTRERARPTRTRPGASRSRRRRPSPGTAPFSR
ncbi:MAG: sugar-binding domain-containing protein [Myxococcota bacterium]